MQSAKNLVNKMAGTSNARDQTEKIENRERVPHNTHDQFETAKNEMRNTRSQPQQSTRSTENRTRGSRPAGETVTTESTRQTAPERAMRDVDTTRGRTDIVTDTTRPDYTQERTKVNPNVTTRDTDVREIVNPAVVKETIQPKEHERTDVEYQRELHQEHFQTRVQPVIDKEVAPEEHLHRTLPTEFREQRATNRGEVERQLEREREQFKDSRTVLPTVKSAEDGRVVAEETRHHHVHEIVQPVLEREVIQPTVIHTTVPVHERIEKDATFHPKTVQPAMTLEEYQANGGTLDGRTASRVQKFAGEPQVVENGGANIKHPMGNQRSGVESSSSCKHGSTEICDCPPNASGAQGYSTTTTTTERTGISRPMSSRYTSSNSSSESFHNKTDARPTGDKTKSQGMKDKVANTMHNAGEKIHNM